MDIESYIISVICASVIAGILLCIVKTNSAYSVLIRFLAGLFVALTAIGPLKNFSLSDLTGYFDHIESISVSSVDAGKTVYTEALRSGIIERTQSYILEKASSMGVQLSVTVIVNRDDPPIPIGVELTGNISPYNKNRISQIIATDLGIPEDAQIWR